MASFKCRLFEILNCYHKGETVGAGPNNNVYKNNKVAWILQKLLNKKLKKYSRKVVLSIDNISNKISYIISKNACFQKSKKLCMANDVFHVWRYERNCGAILLQLNHKFLVLIQIKHLSRFRQKLPLVYKNLCWINVSW